MSTPTAKQSARQYIEKTLCDLEPTWHQWVIFFILLGARLWHQIHWSWWLITAPLWFWYALFIVVTLLATCGLLPILCGLRIGLSGMKAACMTVLALKTWIRKQRERADMRRVRMAADKMMHDSH